MIYEVFTIYDLPKEIRLYKTEKGAKRRVKELKNKGYLYGDVIMLKYEKNPNECIKEIF